MVTAEAGAQTSSYEDWKVEHFGTTEVSATDDPDGDGIRTLLEYAFDLDPNAPEALSKHVKTEFDLSEGSATVTFPTPRTGGDVVYILEQATALDTKDGTPVWKKVISTDSLPFAPKDPFQTSISLDAVTTGFVRVRAEFNDS